MGYRNFLEEPSGFQPTICRSLPFAATGENIGLDSGSGI